MPKIKGWLLHEDIISHGYTYEELHDATKLFDPKGKGVSTRLIGRASSVKEQIFAVSDRRLYWICQVLGRSPDRYSLDKHDQVEIWTPHRPREVFRAYQAIINAIDSNTPPSRCWDFFLENGICFQQYVLENTGEFSTNGKISRDNWKSAFVDLRRRDIVMQWKGNTYRIVSAKRDEMIEILAERTTIEINAARRACHLPSPARKLIVDEMDQVINECNALLKTDHPAKRLIEQEGQFHTCWAGRRSAQRRLLTHVLEVCKQIGDRLLWIDEDDNIQCDKSIYPKEFRDMVDELQVMRDNFNKSNPDPEKIETLIRKHTGRSVRLMEENNIWFNTPCNKRDQ